ncbi:MAG: PDZ domain-containing protein [Gemmatimonadales bacterium]|nr:PDZ domain-containing protein [Gemmatimonadales bacterium]NIN12522.1 PDZ domain-containing protein [Gemmatimonadales bacterium]NIN50893.1 PDZ domain-containing protein [Gemmatimonadales bacterium]NIP08357.1 PDZ domain-containing protein [Gemmatimonadales bacterium]NIR03454.1 PDZ domain-containing protein [Gemmatimonadales bacterium]
MHLRIARATATAVAAASVLCAPGSQAQTPNPTPPTALHQLSESFEALSERVAPAVVQIFSTTLAPLSGDPRGAAPLLGQRRRSGSGVIVSADGYILTNAHVVEGARRLKVVLARPAAEGVPGRSILRPVGQRVEGRVLGTDLETDLAVVKIDQPNLPYLELGDSDNLRPGHLVLAFGSPLGLEASVTMGVVSAVGRQLEPEDPMIYIQTDAPINPGNSGGPLVDTQGRVVGINTLILSQSGGSEGIGFAAPSNIARHVYEQIRTNGRVRRGVVGVNAQTITPTLATGLRLAQDWGVVVSDVYPRSPAARAGLQVGDVIVSLDGKPMENGRQFDVNVYRRPIGGTVTLEIRRGLQNLTVPVKVVERATDPDRFADLVNEDRNLVPQLGVLAVEVDRDIAGMLPWLRRQGGVVVAARSAEAPRVYTGLEPGDVIYSVNGTPVTTLGQLSAGLRGLNSGDPVVLHVDRRGRLMFIAFELE